MIPILIILGVGLLVATTATSDNKPNTKIEDQNKANVVIDAINRIGTVLFNTVSEGLIVYAELQYKYLTSAQKALVTNYNVLTEARGKFNILKAQAGANVNNQAAANNYSNQGAPPPPGGGGFTAKAASVSGVDDINYDE